MFDSTGTVERQDTVNFDGTPPLNRNYTLPFNYVIAVTSGAKMGGNSEALARALESFVLMYEHHAAREDTVIFPAWKQTMTGEQLDEMGEKFEEIGHEQFGEDGYEDAVKRIGEIEGGLGSAPPRPM